LFDSGQSTIGLYSYGPFYHCDHLKAWSRSSMTMSPPARASTGVYRMSRQAPPSSRAPIKIQSL
jgi:hypothetical protein